MGVVQILPTNTLCMKLEWEGLPEKDRKEMISK